MSLKMGFSSFNQQNNRGIMGEDQHVDDDLMSSSSEVSSGFSSESEEENEENEEVISSLSSSSLGSVSSPDGPLNDMSSLLQQLPIKRGLSVHFQGKSQSFTSLSKVLCLEDLAKPENPYNKRIKSCRSYAVLSESHKPTNNPTRNISSKMAQRGSCSSLSGNMNTSFLGKRPPIKHLCLLE